MNARDIRQGRTEGSGPDIVRELRRISMIGALSGYDARILRTAAQKLEHTREMEKRLALYIGADGEDERTSCGLLEE